MTAAPRLDPDRLQRLASDPAASVWVRASAGTGKTKVLTDRMLVLMLADTAPEKILALTFTKAAAAEMANRVAERLSLWATFDDAQVDAELESLLGRRATAEEAGRARTLFAHVTDTPGGLRILTIHAFCQSLLRRFPVEARLAPHFDVMDERTAAEALLAAEEAVLIAASERRDRPLEDAMETIAAEAGEARFSELLAMLGKARGRLRRLFDRLGGVDAVAAAVHRHLGLAPGEGEDAIIGAACADDAFDRTALHALAEALAESDKKTDITAAPTIARWLAADPAGRHAEFEGYLRVFLTAAERPRQKFPTKAIVKGAPAIGAAAEAETERLERVASRRRAARVAAASTALLRLGGAVLDAYGAHKATRALLDYDDLILRARDLLSRERAGWVLYKLDGGIDHILIDEAQDTSPEQWEVVRALAEEFFAGAGARPEGRTLFAVGDVKQSIFSFQGADPTAFERMRAYFEERVEAAGQSWRNVDLHLSFRSTAAVLDAVDAVYATPAARDGVVPTSVAVRHEPFRTGHAGLVELWPLVEPGEAKETRPWAPPEAPAAADLPQVRLARLIAHRVRGWLDLGEILAARGRPLRPGDIMVLVRRRGDFVEGLVRAFKDLGVAVAGVDRMRLTEQLAVMDLIALGRFLLLPSDDLTLACVLKTPLIGLDDARLEDLALGRREASLWRELGRRARTDPAFEVAHARLSALLARADFVPPYELFAEALAITRDPARPSGHRRIAERLGPEAEDPVGEFLALALAYERTHAPSLEGFLHWIETGGAEVKRDLEQTGRDEVRVITVHGAKGLQAPVVILPDTVHRPEGAGSHPRLLWTGEHANDPAGLPLWSPRQDMDDPATVAARAAGKAREAEEYRRLLYVAMTRAEDRLYLCGWRTRNPVPEGCWYELARAGLAGAAVPAAYDFTGDIAAGWSGPGLRLECPQSALPETEEEGREAGAPEPLPAWAARRPEPEPDPPRPLAPSRPAGEEPAVRSPLGADKGIRFRRGLLVHRLLQTLPDLDPAVRAEACRRFLARPGHGLDPAARQALAAEVMAVFEEPAFAALFAPGSRGEVPVAGLVEGRVIRGQIDRLAFAGGDVLVADYKTNRPPPAAPEAAPTAYLAQMAAYRAVLARVYPGRPIRCFLLWTDGPSLMSLPEALLDRHAP